MSNYKSKNKNFRDAVGGEFKNFPLLRFFYGKRFVRMCENMKNKNISHLSILSR